MKKTAVTKTLLLSFCCMLCYAAHAQYNKRLQHSWLGIPAKSYVVDMVNAHIGSYCVLSVVDSFNNLWSPSDKAINLKKLDYLGNILFDYTYHFSDSLRTLEPWRMIMSDDSGFIVVGRVINNSLAGNSYVYSNPFAIKFDRSGLYVWGHTYNSNHQIPYNDSISTSIVRTDESDENYLIVRAGAPLPNHPASTVSVNVVKIDGGGLQLWNKKYMPSLPGTDSFVRDYPTTVAHVYDTGNNYYFIAGSRYRPVFMNSSDSALFFMGIDGNGAIVKSYRYLHVPGNPFGADAIYDDNTNEQSIVISYTQCQNPVFDPTYNTTSYSQIGLIKLGTNLNSKLHRYYWGGASQENIGVRVKKNPFDNAYIVGCDIQNSYSLICNIAQLKVNKSGAVQHITSYNVKTQSNVAGLVGYTDFAGNEYYALGGRANFAGGPDVDMRLISTDDVGNEYCGMAMYEPFRMNYFDTMHIVQYAVGDTTGMDSLVLDTTQLWVKVLDCDPTNGAEFRRYNGGNASAMEGVLKVYPNLLNSESALKIDVTVAQSSRLELSLITIEGKVVANTYFDVESGGSVQSWELNLLQPGQYYLKAQTRDGAVNQVVKLTRM